MEEICPSVNGFPLFLACASSWQIGEKSLRLLFTCRYKLCYIKLTWLLISELKTLSTTIKYAFSA
jgi:hypothetical protein